MCIGTPDVLGNHNTGIKNFYYCFIEDYCFLMLYQSEFSILMCFVYTTDPFTLFTNEYQQRKTEKKIEV